MAAAAALGGVAVDHLVSMFVSPAEAKDATASSVCQQGPALGAATQQIEVGSQTPSQVTVGYSVTPINLTNGQALAEPQILSGTAALALHGLLMKLHAESMQGQLTAKPAAQRDTAAQQSVAVSAAAQASARPSSHVAAAPRADNAHQLRMDNLPPEVLRLLPQELLEQGPAALLQQLQQYLQLKQQLVSHDQQDIQPEQQESHRRPARVHTVHSDPLHALAAACEEQDDDYEQHLKSSGSGGSSTSCTDPLEVSPEHVNHQHAGRGGMQGTLDDYMPWNGPAAAGVEVEEQQLPTVHDMAVYLQQQLQRQRDIKGLRKSARLSEALSTHYLQQARHRPSSDTATPSLAAADDGPGWAAPPSLKRKRAAAAAAGPQYRGVRLRPWGSYGAEVRDPRNGTRVWLGSFHSAEEAALTYDAAVRLLRGSRGVTNLPEPPEPERSKYRTKVQALLSKAYARQPGVHQQQSQQLIGDPALQQDDDDGFMQEAADAADLEDLSTAQQQLRKQYQQPDYWKQQQQQQLLAEDVDQVPRESQTSQLDEQQQQCRQELHQQLDFWTGSGQPVDTEAGDVAGQAVDTSQAVELLTTAEDTGLEQQQQQRRRQEQMGLPFIAGTASPRPAVPDAAQPSDSSKPASTGLPDVGAYSQQAAQFEEELRQLQSVMQLGQAGGAVSDGDLGSRLVAPDAGLQPAAVAVKVEL